MSSELLAAERAFNAARFASDEFTTAVGEASAPSVERASLAWAGLTERLKTYAQIAVSVADLTMIVLGESSEQGRVIKSYYDGLVADGEAVAKRMEAQAAAAKETVKATREARANVGVSALNRPAEEEKAPYDQAAEQARIRLEVIRGLRQADLDDLRAYEAEATEVQFQALSETLAMEKDVSEKSRALAAENARAWADAYDAQRSAAFSVADSITGLLGDLVSENRDASIAIFATRKALAVGEIAVNTAVAASRAIAELGPIAGAPVAAAITAAGVAQGVAVGAMAIGEGINTFGQAQQAQVPPTINATLVVEGQPIRNGVRTRRVGQR